MMDIVFIKSFLAWCSLINIVLFAIWFLFFLTARGWLYNFHGRLYNLSEERFNAIHYTGMLYYKLGILLFNVVPYLVLRILG